ncbi:YoaK family protein [Streptomyces sp. NPDC088560]|uniref:YoaK family protein n=1 Tax=Streptomyces sp. NPDC088560 TaxID=3365868 RepID=UPI00382D771D
MSDAAAGHLGPGTAGTTGRLLAPLVLLTLLSGVIDAVGLLGPGHVFVANMTGNLVLVGLGLAGSPGSSPVGALAALGGFLLGALLVRHGAPRRAGHRTLLGGCAALEAALLTVATLARSCGAGPEPALVPVLVCAVALGMQNAVVRRIGVPGVTTTVMTSTLTALIANRPEERASSTTRRQALSILTLVGGAALGAAAVRLAGPRWTLTLVTALAVAAALACARRGPAPVRAPRQRDRIALEG